METTNTNRAEVSEPTRRGALDALCTLSTYLGLQRDQDLTVLENAIASMDRLRAYLNYEKLREARESLAGLDAYLQAQELPKPSGDAMTDARKSIAGLAEYLGQEENPNMTANEAAIASMNRLRAYLDSENQK